MTTIDLSSLQATSFNTETGAISFRAVEAAAQNHPDPINFSPKVSIHFDITPSAIEIRNLMTGLPSNPDGTPITPAPEVPATPEDETTP